MIFFTGLLFLALLTLSSAQYAHRDVIENAQNEALLPDYLKSPHYKIPRVRAALTHFSWFGPGEKPVYERAADNISKREIYNVLSHAGLIPRNNKYFRFPH